MNFEVECRVKYVFRCKAESEEQALERAVAEYAAAGNTYKSEKFILVDSGLDMMYAGESDDPDFDDLL